MVVPRLHHIITRSQAGVTWCHENYELVILHCVYRHYLIQHLLEVVGGGDGGGGGYTESCPRVVDSSSKTAAF